MSKVRGEKVADDQIRQYINALAAKKGDGSGVSVEHLRKHFGIGYKRAKRLHDDELGPTNPDSSSSGGGRSSSSSKNSTSSTTAKRDASDAVSDEAVIAFIHKCRDEGRDISTNELRHELHIGYKRAVRLLTQGDKPARPVRSPSTRKRSSLSMLQEAEGDDDDDDDDGGLGSLESVGAIDELAALHHHLHQTSPGNKRARRGRKAEGMYRLLCTASFPSPISLLSPPSHHATPPAQHRHRPLG
jgi:DNA segregation ATPase FtsK/SpoIIIE-like protein